MKNYKEFESRRKVFSHQIGDGVAVLFNSSEMMRNRDSHYPFRSDSYFHYLSGFSESDAVIFILGGKTPKSILFCKSKNKEKEMWNGFIYGPKNAAEIFLFDEAYPLDKINEVALKVFANQKKIYCIPGPNGLNDNRINQWVDQNKKNKRAGSRSLEMIIDLTSTLDKMRVIKSNYELSLMKRSASIAAKAHIFAMRKTKPGKYEYQIEGEILNQFMQNGSHYPAYQSIVASGGNACTLHYVENNSLLKDGDLLLIDAGCEFEGYASDITRTYPVNGKFSSAQRDLYQIVLDAQKSAIESICSGKLFDDPHKVAVRKIIDGLMDLKICSGSYDEILETGAYKNFFMHRTSHWLGLDVHDAGDYVDEQSNPAVLVSGNVLTVEPGCYIQPSSKVPKDFWGMGIRIEDDVCVTKDGCVILSYGAPKDINHLEEVVGTLHD
jgi:Xaa-Pro aminopeptidase